MSFMKTGIRASLLLALTLALASTAQADRRTGMYGNLLITDQDDLFLFPQEVLTYRNRISLDYGAGTGTGNGLFTMGDESSAFGLAIHRGDTTIPNLFYFDGPTGAQIPGAALSDPGSPVVGDPFPQVSPATMVDLMYAMDSGLGMRLAFGPASNSQTLAGTDSGETEFYALATVGFGTGVRGDDGRYDFSGSILFDSASQVQGGTDTLSAAVFALSGLFRGFLPMDETMDLGLLGGIGLSSSQVSFDSAMPTAVSSTLGFGATVGAGPSFRFGDASVAAYGTLALNVSATEPNDQVDNDQTGTAAIVIPGVNVAVEVPINDWFFVRTGADYRWVSNSNTNEDNSMAADTANAATQFGWNAGAGVKAGSLTFDGALSHGFVTGGPNFISGAAGNLFLMANLTYDFDDARSGVVAEEPAAAEPADDTAEQQEASAEEAEPAPIEPAPVGPVPADPNAPAPVAPAPAEPLPAPIAPLPLPAAPPGQ